MRAAASCRGGPGSLARTEIPLPAPPPQGLFGLVGDLALAGRPSDHTARSLSGGDSSIEFEVGWSPVNIRLTPRAPAKTPYTGTKQFFFQA